MRSSISPCTGCFGSEVQRSGSPARWRDSFAAAHNGGMNVGFVIANLCKDRSLHCYFPSVLVNRIASLPARSRLTRSMCPLLYMDEAGDVRDADCTARRCHLCADSRQSSVHIKAAVAIVFSRADERHFLDRGSCFQGFHHVQLLILLCGVARGSELRSCVFCKTVSATVWW